MEDRNVWGEDTMGQPTFADLEYESKKRKTRREIFLERMDSLIPWEQLEERIRPFYPRVGRWRLSPWYSWRPLAIGKRTGTAYSLSDSLASWWKCRHVYYCDYFLGCC